VKRCSAARLLLIVILLASWQAALVHPLEHVDGQGRLVHMGDGQAHDDNTRSHSSPKLCDTLAALTACLCGEARLVALEALEATHVAFASARARRADPPPFLSQGPPTPL